MASLATFSQNPHRMLTFVCALTMSFAIFAILPLSLSADIKSKPKETLTRVYSISERQNVLRNSEHKSSASRYAIPEFSAPSSPIVNLSRARNTLGFNLEIPDFSSNSGTSFELSNFGGAKVDDEISVFELDALDRIPKRLNNPRLSYPTRLLKLGVEGCVWLDVVISESGDVESAEIAKSDDDRFNDCALTAAKSLLYESPTKNGRAVRAKFTLPIPFKIQK